MSWRTHKTKWSDCKNCELWETRKRVVLLKGQIPCDILFIGEAPGVGEDVLGQPFVGPAGHLLDRMVKDSVPSGTRLAFTNLIACIPLDVDGNKVKEPHKEHIQACQERLQEVYDLCRPSAVVMVGGLAAKWVPKLVEGLVDARVDIIHPAAILRADPAQKGLAIQQTMVRLEELADELVPF